MSDIEGQSFYKNVERYVDAAAAKMVFKYEILNPEGKVVCTGETVQVFVELFGELSLEIPQFFKDWKIKTGLIDG